MTTSPLGITAETPLTTTLVDHLAAIALTEIQAWADQTGVDVDCWFYLHHHLDTDELTEAAGVPWGVDVETADDPAGIRWILAVEYRVDELLHTTASTARCNLMTDPGDIVDG